MQPEAPSPAMRIMAQVSRAKAQQVREIETRTTRYRVMMALFMGEDGALIPDAEWFFADLAQSSAFYRYGFEQDARFQDFMAGQRALLSDIFDGFHLDAERLRQLHTNLERVKL